MATLPPVPDEGLTEEVDPNLPTPISPEGLGRFTAFEVSPEPMYSEEALGPTIAGAIKSMVSDHKTTQGAARAVELIEAWEARAMERGRQFNLHDREGLRPYGDNERGGYMEAQDVAEMFAVNITGARKDKIVAACTREVPGIQFVGGKSDALHMASADESNKYVKVWQDATDARSLAANVFGFFYTDGRVLLYTRTVANEQAWGVGDDGRPAMKEITTAHGKMEHSLPIYVDDLSQMGWVRVVVGDFSENTLKEKFQWVAKKIGGEQSPLDSHDSLERTARMAVKGGTRYGVTKSGVLPEVHVWLRPSEYWADEKAQPMLKQMFPKGMEVVFAGGVLAYVRSGTIEQSIDIRHSRTGDGQNRRAIGANIIPVQKVLNRAVTLFNRYVTQGVPRKYGDPERLNIEAANKQINEDPTQLIPMLSGGQATPPIYVEETPQPPAQLLEFITSLRDQWPQEMDGATPAMFGLGDNETLGEALLNRDQAIQVFGTPYVQMTIGLAKSCEKAVYWAVLNQRGVIDAQIPGEGRLSVDTAKIRGRVYGHPEGSAGIPESEAEVQARLLEMIEQSPNIPLYASIMQYAGNLPAFKSLLRIRGMKVPGADSVQKQLGNIEKLKSTAPQENPAVVQAQSALQQMEAELADHPNPTPEMQQGLQQVQQQMAAVPPLLSSIPIAQDASENHQIAAAVDVEWLNSSEGQKYQTGNPQMQAGYHNVYLDWQAHDAMAKKLSPPPPPEVKPGLSLAVDKIASPEVQAALISQEYGVSVTPQQLAPDATQMPHEITTEKEGVDANGVKTKQKISVSPGGRVN